MPALKDFLKESIHGLIVERMRPENSDEGLLLPVIGMKDMQEEGVALENLEMFSLKEGRKPLWKYAIAKDDLIACLKVSSVFRCFVVEQVVEEVIIPRQPVVVLRFKDPRMVRYVCAYLESEAGQAQIGRLMKPSSKYYIVSIEDLKNLKIPDASEESRQLLEDAYKELRKTKEQAEQSVRDGVNKMNAIAWRLFYDHYC